MTSIRIILLFSTLILFQASIASTVFNTRPFDSNLRIMSFSNAFSTMHPSKIPPRKRLVSSNGIDAYPIVGSKAIKGLFDDNTIPVTKLGGMINLHKLIELKRREVSHKNTLLFDAGGSIIPIINSENDFLKEVMSMHIDMSVDVMSIGNELKYGKKFIEEIATEYSTSSISVLSTNLKDTGGFLFNPFKEYTINGKTIVVIGYSNTDIIIPQKVDLSSNDEYKNLLSMVAYFSTEADLIIVLSANSVDTNKKLSIEVPGIDIIIGGSDSLILPHPISQVNDHGSTMILTTGSNANFLSVMDIDLGSNGVNRYRYAVHPAKGNIRELAMYEYELFNKVSGASANNLIKFNRDAYTGYTDPGLFDIYIMNTLKSFKSADIIIGSPPQIDIFISDGSYLQVEDVNRYFHSTNHRLVETFISGPELVTALENYYNTHEFSTTTYKPLRTLGFDYKINKIDNRYKVTISKIKGETFSSDKKYKLVGWGDIIDEDVSNPQIEEIMIEAIKLNPFRPLPFNNNIQFFK